MGLLQERNLISAIAVIVLVWIVTRLVAYFKDRARFQKLPGPPYSKVFGHLIALGKVAMKLPARAHPHILVAQLMREYDLPPVFYMDSRPVSILSLVVTDPDVARQVSEAGLLKHPSVVTTLEPFAGKLNMVTTSGPLWKKWRVAFNPGFSATHLIAQVPMMVDCCQEFIKALDGHASANRSFRMEEEATKITIDNIGKLVCDHDFKSFSPDSQFVGWMRGALLWAIDHQSINPFHRYSLLRRPMTMFYRWKMSTYVGKILDERFSARGDVAAKSEKKRTIIDLALETYVEENRDQSGVGAGKMNKEFRKAAIDNLLVLLFAGHDTTASTLCYCWKLLTENLHTLASARKELDDVFGVGISAAVRLRESPHLINRLVYTHAVIKEVLRLWPPASSARMGSKDFFIRDPVTGDMLPTEGANVWTPPFVMGRSRKIWGGDVDEFKPERFLPENALKVPAEAWRSFEKGPRNCIGQEFAWIEMKVVLALTLREFDIRTAFDELESLKDDGTLWTKDSSFRKGPQEAFGEPMYQVLLAAAKPREGMPTRIERRRHF